MDHPVVVTNLPGPARGPTAHVLHKPRLVMYQQTFHDGAGKYISLMPLLEQKTGISHLIIAAVHLNTPSNITLNDHPLDDERYEQLWKEVRLLQDAGVKVMAMLGGAAVGTYRRLSGNGVCILAARMNALSRSNASLLVPAPLRQFARAAPQVQIRRRRSRH
jgi:hypothetical protein